MHQHSCRLHTAFKGAATASPRITHCLIHSLDPLHVCGCWLRLPADFLPTTHRYILLHTVAAAVLSFEKQTQFVAIITAFATAVLTWVEYRSHEQKLILFTTAVHALQSRIIWWDSLRRAEQTPAQFANLVRTSEQIIQDVRPLGKLMPLNELASGGNEAEGTAAGKAAIVDGKAATDKAATSEVRSRNATAP